MRIGRGIAVIILAVLAFSTLPVAALAQTTPDPTPTADPSATPTPTPDPTATKVLVVKVTVGTSATASRATLVEATSTHDPSKVDAVKAVMKRG